MRTASPKSVVLGSLTPPLAARRTESGIRSHFKMKYEMTSNKTHCPDKAGPQLEKGLPQRRTP